MRLFLDANVLWSAASHPGAVHDLLQALRQSGHALVVDGFVIEEARRNLQPAAQVRLAAWILMMEVHPAAELDAHAAAHGLPSKDVPVLRAAIASRCDVLVTGDRRHFRHLMGRRVEGVLVLATSSAVGLISDEAG